jgi:hypothetical protein
VARVTVTPARVAELSLIAFEALLRATAYDGLGPSADLRAVLAVHALAAPVAAMRLPMVRSVLPADVRRDVTKLAIEASHAPRFVVDRSAEVPRASAGGRVPGQSRQVSTAAAARRLGVESHAVRVAASRGRLHGVKDDAGRWTFTTTDLDRYDDERRHHGAER